MTELEIVLPYLPFVVVGCTLAAIGRGIQAAIGRSTHPAAIKWTQTRVAHPVIAGLLIGWWAPLPVPPSMGESVAARVFWFGFAGVCAVPLYEAMRRWWKRKTST